MHLMPKSMLVYSVTLCLSILPSTLDLEYQYQQN